MRLSLCFPSDVFDDLVIRGRCRREYAVYGVMTTADTAAEFRGAPKHLPLNDMCERCKKACK